jgi:hypothetical protein
MVYRGDLDDDHLYHRGVCHHLFRVHGLIFALLVGWLA